MTRAAADDAASVARRHDRFEKAARLLPLLQQSGVTILAGTDAGFLNSFNYPGIGLHDELEILVRYGLTPQQALAASVVHGPAFLGEAATSARLRPAGSLMSYCSSAIRSRTFVPPEQFTAWCSAAGTSIGLRSTGCWPRPRRARRRRARGASLAA